MHYTLDLKVEERYLYATASGMRTRKSVAMIAKEVFEACQKHKANRVIVDVCQLGGRIPIFDSLSVIFEEFPHIKEAQIIEKAALIDSKIRKLRDSFFERVARSKGYNIRIFSEPEIAIEWILKDE
jgi:hypothetical protein